MSLLRIAHLSDPHFGTILPGVAEGLLATLHELRPDLVLMTGDITQRARRWQFRAARDFTRQLPDSAKLIAVPGNHDIPLYNLPMRLFAPYRGFKKLFKDQLEKDFVHGDVCVLGLNSTAWWRHVQGDFNLARLERRLRSQPEKAKVRIAAFHHPMDCADYVDQKNLLRGRERAIELFEENGIDLMIGGHIHDPYVTLSKQRYPTTQRNMIIGVAGTCTSWRIRPYAPNSFNWIEVDTSAAAARLNVVRYDIRGDKRFTPEARHEFTRNSAGSWMKA